MSRDVSLSMSDDIKTFVDFYADLHGTTPSAMAKRGLYAEIKRHPLKPTQVAEFESKYGEVPSAFGHTRPVRPQDYIFSSPNSPSNQESSEDKTKDKETYAEGVTMLKAEYLALCAKYGQATIDLAIQKVAAQQIKVGKSYKSPRGAILQWGIRAALEEKARGKGDGIDRSPAKHPPCDFPGCSRECVRGLGGYWDCPEHGRREEVS